jgi:hypothetical protein
MSKLCQISANETLPGPEHDRMEFAARKFRVEADELAIRYLDHALDWME